MESGAMSVNLKALQDRKIVAQVVSLYTKDFLTMVQVVSRTGLTIHTVSAILRQELTAEQHKARRSANHSRSKDGKNNPMWGIRRERLVRIGRYLKRWNGRDYTPEHRRIVMEALGLTTLPSGWEVHHINGDPLDNSLDNLALVTTRGHQILHRQGLSKLYQWEKEQFGTSLLKKMKATPPKD